MQLLGEKFVIENFNLYFKFKKHSTKKSIPISILIYNELNA